jgi:hypothetical protein
MQMSEETAVRLLRTRLARHGVNLPESEVAAVLVACRAQGWKFTARDPDTDMLDSVKAIYGPDSEITSTETLWRRMWDHA